MMIRPYGAAFVGGGHGRDESRPYTGFCFVACGRMQYAPTFGGFPLSFLKNS
jgi:hypothetical protein